MRGQVTKYLFIDSSVEDGNIHLPPHPFSTVDEESMALTLLSFSMRKNIPQINNTNNTSTL